MDRRKFIKNTGATGVLIAAAPAAFSNTIFQNHTSDIKYIAAIVLSGGVREMDFTKTWEELYQPEVFNGYRLYTNLNLESSDISHHQSHMDLYRNGFRKTSKKKINLFLEDSNFIPRFKEEYLPKIVSVKSGNKSFSSQDIKSPLNIFHREGFDKAHYNMKGYQALIRSTIKDCHRLWEDIQSNPVTMDKTAILITTDMGRNNTPNLMGGLDHHTEDAKRVFCLVTAPKNVTMDAETYRDQKPVSMIGDLIKELNPQG